MTVQLTVSDSQPASRRFNSLRCAGESEFSFGCFATYVDLPGAA